MPSSVVVLERDSNDPSEWTYGLADLPAERWGRLRCDEDGTVACLIEQQPWDSTFVTAALLARRAGPGDHRIEYDTLALVGVPMPPRQAPPQVAPRERSRGRH